MTKALLYARYSTAMQSAASVEDQFRLLRQRADREGWSIVGEQADRAISGTVRDRPGLNCAMQAIENGEANILLAEALDRISRDQEDLARIFKRIRFRGARIVTLSEGEVGSLHIGMGGTISAVYVEQLAEKTRRGQIGRVEAGRIPGGNSYGYRPVRKLREDGEPERGLREIDEDQADIVRRIFHEYAEGRSPREIAARLNAEGVPSPRGGHWRASTIIGHRQRRNGILNNELYRGRILYNRQSFRKDPETRKRVSRPNAESELVTADVPTLRIVDEDLWKRVHDRVASYGDRPSHMARRPKRLMSGLLRCGSCGGTVTILGADRWGCSSHKQTGTCANGTTITNAVLERRVLSALKRELLHPDVIAAYLEELKTAADEARREIIGQRADRQQRLDELQRESDRMVDAIVRGVDPDQFVARSHAIAEERRSLQSDLDDMPDFASMVAHPAAIQRYHRHIADLHDALAQDPDLQPSLRAILNDLVEKIEVMPRQDGKRGVDLIVHGDLAALLQIDQAKPANPSDCTVKMVAGVGFE
ncbi:MAG: recombinase family protein, partial [Novosphingobium sp.]|nr:recombinase family protein [Novosphingobium sp.]